MKKNFTPPMRLFITVAAVVMGLFECLESKAQTWKGVDPTSVAVTSVNTADEQNYVFIYNVKTGKYLNRGGNWGTEAVLSDVGMEFEVTKKTVSSTTYYYFHSQMTGQGSVTPFVSFSEGGGSTSTNWGAISSGDKKDYYVDQGGTAFQFEQTTYNGQTVYKIKHAEYIDYNTTTYYMAAGKASGSSSTADEDICISGYTSAATDGSAYWMFIPVSEREGYIKNLGYETIEQAPATYLMKDNDFARRSTDVSYWKYGTKNTSFSNGTSLENDKQVTSNNTKYYVGGYNYDTTESGDATTANILGASGMIWQNLSDLPAAGWYEVRCNAFTTAEGKASMFASVANKTQASTLETEYVTRPIATAPTSITSGTIPTSFSSSTTQLTTAEETINSTTTIAGETIYPYQVIARVYVGEENGSPQTLTLGVLVDGAESNTWTCIDNFQISYIGKAYQSVVIDENQESVDDMNEQTKKDYTSTIYLHRSLTANTWNSIVLPFSMTHSDIVAIFGVNTYVAKFEGAKDASNPNTLYFSAVSTIAANTPYIIKPTIGEPEYTSPTIKAAKVTYGSDGTTTTTETELTKYYTIHKTFYSNSASSDGRFPETVSGATGKEDANDDTVNLLFKGTYIKKSKQVPAGSYNFYASASDAEGSTGEWKYSTNAVSSRAFRAWLERVDASTPAKEGFKISFDGIDDTATAIDGVTYGEKTKAADGRVYNILGQVVASDASQLSTLAKGLYIVGGKKVYVK